MANTNYSYILTNIPEYIIGQKYHELLSPERPSKSIVQIFGLNSGNCMFWESTKKNHKQSNRFKTFGFL